MTHKKDDCIDALNILFWKLPTPEPWLSLHGSTSVAAFWVSELQDKGISVEWNALEGRFQRPREIKP